VVDYERMGRTVRELREARGLSQEGLAQHLSETANTISRWETGTYRPSATQLESLANFFGVSITTFFPGMEKQEVVPTALLSATKGLRPEDLEEVIKYAEFRRARARLRKGKKKGELEDD